MTHPSRASLALLLTIALHLALLLGLLTRHPQPARRTKDGPAIQWLLPMPSTPRAAMPQALTAARVAARPAKRPAERAAAPLSAGAPAEAVTPNQATATTAGPASTDMPEPVIGDLSAQPAMPPVSAGELLRLAMHGAGKVDRELRGGKLAALPPSGPTLRGKIDAAFEAAHEAVPPKWYEQARISELGTGDSRVRLYKIKTALGTYCIRIEDASISFVKGQNRPPMTYVNCP